MKTNKICIILPYFGKFNSYFNLWLQSCRYNSRIDWYIFTDDKTKYSFPDNIRVSYYTFSDVQQLAYKLWGDDILLESPYDLCKFRVAYHVLFPQVVEKYEYWGFCDCDLIFGDIYSAILPAINQDYDKISWRGHFTLFRNKSENKNIYLENVPCAHTFRDCISKVEKDYYNLFDEVGINFIFDYLGKTVYKKLLIADLDVKKYNFICKHFSQSEEYKNNCQIFEWDNGHLYRVYLFNGELFKEEFAYVHFLRRWMKNLVTNSQCTHYLIIPPNKFIDYEEVTVDKVYSWTRKKFYWSYYKRRLTFKNVCNKISGMFFVKKNKIPDVYSYIIK